MQLIKKLSLYAGNKNLCGSPLDPCQSIPEPITNSPPPNAPPINNVVPLLLRVAIIAIVVGLILALIAVALFIFQWRKQKSEAQYYEASLMEGSRRKLPSIARQTDQSSHKLAPEVTSHSRRRDDAGKLSFVRDDIEKFDLQDMLRASAEVLGSGTFGASYKAVIMSGQTLVVKRYKQMNTVGREEFHEHMRRLGNLKHPNVLPLVAYYYRREEKLLITEFVHNNSLANHLHGMCMPFSHTFLLSYIISYNMILNRVIIIYFKNTDKLINIANIKITENLILNYELCCNKI